MRTVSTTALSPWYDFYKKRINSGYQAYFTRRYAPMLIHILSLRPSFIREEGIGIGSVSKALSPFGIGTRGFDLDAGMIELCSMNVPQTIVYQDNILDPDMSLLDDREVVVTHGVLEHFSDAQITSIFDRYKQEGVKNIHYVPTNGYTEPSFGDERLLPYEYWLDLLQPTFHIRFNGNKDLLLINF